MPQAPLRWSWKTTAAELVALGKRLFVCIEECDELDILLLTKRPENAFGMVPNAWRCNWRPWVWLGTTVENQEMADKRIPELLRIPARVRFLSMEPLLEQVDLGPWALLTEWIIVGGESGKNARPMHPDWARKIRDQCVAAGVPFFFKQWGGIRATVHWNRF